MRLKPGRDFTIIGQLAHKVRWKIFWPSWRALSVSQRRQKFIKRRRRRIICERRLLRPRRRNLPRRRKFYLLMDIREKYRFLLNFGLWTTQKNRRSNQIKLSQKMTLMNAHMYYMLVDCNFLVRILLGISSIGLLDYIILRARCLASFSSSNGCSTDLFLLDTVHLSSIHPLSNPKAIVRSLCYNIPWALLSLARWTLAGFIIGAILRFALKFLTPSCAVGLVSIVDSDITIYWLNLKLLG